jgi:hypothetical protein
MGSRAVIVLCHTTDVAAKRFGINDGSRGIIYTRTGRHFFEDRSLEQLILERLDRVLTDKGFWKEFHTDWVCLDTELMPWSEKAQALLQQQYAPVGRAGRDALDTTVDHLLSDKPPKTELSILRDMEERLQRLPSATRIDACRSLSNLLSIVEDLHNS